MAVALALSAASLALVALAVLAVSQRERLTRGQDAAGKGMYPGCLMIVLAVPALGLAVAAAAVAAGRWSRLGWPTRVVALLPLAIFALVTAVSVGVEATIRRRSAAAAYAAEIAEPAGLVVDVDDARFLALYNALRPFIGDVELSCRPPLALYWQQREWLPRARVLFVNGDDLAAPEGKDLLHDLCKWKPQCPIVLHYERSDAVAAPLRKAGWEVTPVEQAGADWVENRWLPVARELMERELARRPGPAREEE
jgi:hypothetical protein